MLQPLREKQMAQLQQQHNANAPARSPAYCVAACCMTASALFGSYRLLQSRVAAGAAESRRSYFSRRAWWRNGGGSQRLQVCVLIRFHFPRISTHLLRPLHVDKRGRQPFDFHKLHGRSTAEAENNAVGELLMRHASGLRVDGDAICVLGPSAYHGLHGGCSVHSAVHFNCSGSSVTHAVTRSCPFQLPPPAPAPQPPSRHTGQENFRSFNPFTSTSPTVGGNLLLPMTFSWPPRRMRHQPLAPLHRSTATNAPSCSRSCGRV